MTKDVIDNVARLVVLLYASFRHEVLYHCLVQTKWSIRSYTGQITTLQPPQRRQGPDPRPL